MTEPVHCPKGHVIPAELTQQADGKPPICPTCAGVSAMVVAALISAIKNRKAHPFRVFEVKTYDEGHLVTHAVSAETVQMSEKGHLLFFANGNLVRIYAPRTWFGMRDVTSEGPSAVAAFLASFERGGAGTA